MKDKTLLIKRSIEKDGLPKEKGLYVVIYKDMPLGCLFSKEKNSWVSGDYRVDKEITHWYEEIPLSKLLEELMPTDFDGWIWASRYEWTRTNSGKFMWFKRSKAGTISFDELGKTMAELLQEYINFKSKLNT